MNELTYKHLQITTRPETSNMVEGRVDFFYGNQLYTHCHISESEAECLCVLNKHVKEFGDKLKALNP